MDLLEVPSYNPAGEPDGQRPSSKQISNVMIELSTIITRCTCHPKTRNPEIPC